jgi:hypothetical protein
MRIRSLLLLLCLAGLVGACESTEPNPLAGSFEATTFIVTEVGEPPTDVLALGGSLSITIAQNNSVNGTLSLPPELTGGNWLSVSMVGTATRTGNTVHFDQQGDTFVREVDWTFSGNTLNATETTSGVTLNITLTRQ